MLSLSSGQEDHGSSGVIESIIVQPSAVRRHLCAPMLEARETYLGHLITRGFSNAVLRDRAVRICDVIDFIRVEQRKLITDLQIKKASLVWIEKKHVSPKQVKPFIAAARSWFQFLGLYSRFESDGSHFDEHLNEFLSELRDQHQYLPTTIAGYGGCVKRFLMWASSRTDELSQITQSDVDAFLASKRRANCVQRTIKAYCKGLRIFFQFAERRGWSDQGLSVSISAPNSRRPYTVLECPPWKTVRSLIGGLDTFDPCECRGKAILLLASLYGMRTCEIVRLTLEDLDWYNEVITIRRAKRGKIQQFPLVFEVGESLIRYLREVRPHSPFRNVFLTLRRPHRPVHNLQQTMRRFMKERGMAAWPCGLHTLRHACATELLRKGTSLQGIADYLGHRDIRSVSAYAQSDFRALRNVARFSLEGVL